jgi:hypothetical protein
MRQGFQPPADERFLENETALPYQGGSIREYVSNSNPIGITSDDTANRIVLWESSN